MKRMFVVAVASLMCWTVTAALAFAQGELEAAARDWKRRADDLQARIASHNARRSSVDRYNHAAVDRWNANNDALRREGHALVVERERLLARVRAMDRSTPLPLTKAPVMRLLAQAPKAPTKVALLVGINNYSKRGLAAKPLTWAERDVTELSKVLSKGGFSVRLLTGSAAGDDKATKANIEAALDELLKGRGASDVVLVGLAGHGQQLKIKGKEDAFFCAHDSELSDAKTMVSLSALVRNLDRKGGVNLVLVDACRDNPDPGRGARSITGNELEGKLPSNTAVLFSCAAGQQAFETKDAGGGHGVFFHHVLQGLRGEAKNKKGDVTWDSLVAYTREHVNDRAKEWFPDRAKDAKDGELQTPHQLTNLVKVPVLLAVR
jgi:Caspase domain